MPFYAVVLRAIPRSISAGGRGALKIAARIHYINVTVRARWIMC